MGATFYVVATAMAVVALALVAAPLWLAGRRLTAAGSALLIVVGVLALYPLASNYIVRSPAYLAVSQATTEEEARAAVEALAAELEDQPDDYSGWRLLGRGYMELGEFPPAINAFRRAMAIGGYDDPELKVLLGEAITYAGGQGFPPEATDLFIAAYAEAPNNAKAQWYAGLAYAALGEPNKAADAWEAMLRQSPPENVAAVLRERIAALRGAAVGDQPPSGAISMIVTLNASLAGQLPDSARLYLSVRNAEQGGPPLAARQYEPSALPLQVSLDDRDAMVAGRTISSAETVLVTARISMSGDPLGGSGDYIGRQTLRLSELNAPISLQINEVVQ